MNLTTIVAIWGAGLSTAMAIRDLMRSRGSARVELVRGTVDDPADGPEHGLYLLIANPSGRPIYVTSAGLMWPYRRATTVDRLKHLLRYRSGWGSVGWTHWYLPVDLAHGLPATIEPGDSHNIFLPYGALIMEPGEGETLRGYVQDALHRSFRSPAINLRAAELAQTARRLADSA